MRKKKYKPRFKKNSIIKSQLPHPSSPHARTLYLVQDILDEEYKICDYPSKKNSERVPFKYIDTGCYIDRIYIYNYILYKEEIDGKDSSQNSIGDKERHQQGRRKKAKPKAYRALLEDAENQSDRGKSRAAAGCGKGRTSSSSEPRARPRRKKEEDSIRRKARKSDTEKDI